MNFDNSEFVKFVRSQFPFFENNKENWALFENAGGSQTLKGVIDNVVNYLSGPNVQPEAHNPLSDACRQKISEGVNAVSTLINSQDPEKEICIGSSSTQLLLNLSDELEPIIPEGSEMILTNCDHESNLNCWHAMALRRNLLVKEWKINKDTFELEIESLEALLNENTRVISFTHCSNVLGIINPVEEYVKVIRAKSPKAIIVVDGVAIAPHRMFDVQAIDADFYVYSSYKAYGLHMAVLHGKSESFEALNKDPRNIKPKNYTYEFAYSLAAINEYYVNLAKKFTPEASGKSQRDWIQDCFKIIGQYEEVLTKKFLDFLRSHKDIKIIGSEEYSCEKRVPIISFIVRRLDSEEICNYLSKKNIDAKFGDSYCPCMMKYLDLSGNYGSKNGVVRISMVHYNSFEDVDRLIHELSYFLSQSSQS